jgi:biopolymer transport protein ExbD
VRSSVPTTAMANMALLLLILYVATTLLKLEEGPAVTPANPPTIHVRLDGGGRISIDGRPVTMDQVEGAVKGMLVARPHLTVAFDADDRVPYPAVADVLEKLGRASAARVLVRRPDAGRRGAPPGLIAR